MKSKAIFKKWWFWVIVAVVVLAAVGSFSQSSSDTTTPDAQQQSNNKTSKSTLPQLKAEDYEGEEGLVAYKELRAKGYEVNAEFENQALTDINGKASDVFKPLDPKKAADRQSVDTFVVGELNQDGDTVALIIAHKPN